MEPPRPGEPLTDPVSAFAPLAGKRVYIETYGCAYNFGDSANLVEILRYYGSVVVESPEEADAVIVNTCTVVGPTERRMLRRLSALREKLLYVTGCMPLVQREAILSVCTPVFIHPDTIREAYRSVLTVSPAGGVGIVQIAQGCLGHCTYCLTRRARGPLVSFPTEEIVRKVQAFVAAGACEIQLTAQDVSAYGHDTGTSLPALLSAIVCVPGNYRIRVGMMNPATVLPLLDDLVDVFSSDRIFRFLHLPVQSGSDRILGQMGRGYTVQEFETIVAAFRARYPGIGISTDVIVGFPGETEEDFSRTLALIGRVRPAKVNVTRYSKRPFTGPFEEKDFPDAVKKDRSRILNAYAEEQYSATNRSLLGTTVSCMVTEKLRPGSVMARTAEYTGVVLGKDLPLGSRINAVLTRDRKYFFMGRKVPDPSSP
ncbi:tRNA (N(6)-L-threonylcarbamoyladenosine(37)-C(2))-methylthiotransferase [Methanoregula sp. UBA64]|uniref:tRNA (N(6)-L-threonylcarbamoyladenosine(37)-C(2))- methylthiotransferase n=1 Tax=Methanoregula sp. UBA64 TaxID=1915554 RepID=UPI0025EA1F49|nr:tRNA (N(6)-L-threonylcarbamoyladenosine(37)-C(2))-methylthiotransferase [Methanoregula sp. UBA64]